MSWIQHSSASCCAYCPVRLSSANWGYFSLSTCGKQSHRSLTSFCIGNQSRHLANPREELVGGRLSHKRTLPDTDVA